MIYLAQTDIMMDRIKVLIQSFSDIITNSSSEIFQTISGSEEVIKQIEDIFHPLFKEDGWYDEDIPTMRVCYKSKIEEDPEEYGFEDADLSNLPEALIEIWLPYGLDGCTEFFRAGIKALLETNNITDYIIKDE